LLPVKVKDHKDLIRDIESGVILNTNPIELKNYLQQKKNIQNHKNQIDLLKQEMSEIKNLLLTILARQT
jgi:hypothetical protein